MHFALDALRNIKLNKNNELDREIHKLEKNNEDRSSYIEDWRISLVKFKESIDKIEKDIHQEVHRKENDNYILEDLKKLKKEINESGKILDILKSEDKWKKLIEKSNSFQLKSIPNISVFFTTQMRLHHVPQNLLLSHVKTISFCRINPKAFFDKVSLMIISQKISY